MNLFESAVDLFGLQFKKKETDQALSGALSTGLDDDGSSNILSSAASGSFGTYLDQDGQMKTEAESIRKYREISLFAEVDVAIQEIVNEAIPQEQDTKLIDLNLDDLDMSDGLKEKITTEFGTVLKLFKYDENAADLFLRWYVDGRLPFQIIVDKNNLESGIQQLVLLNAQNVKKMKEITTRNTGSGATVIDKVEEYFVYNENSSMSSKGATIQSSNVGASQSNALKISADAIIYCTSGIIDNNSGMILSHLHKAIRPINQLRMLEDATVVYFIARAPERRVFYVDVGNLPKLKAEQYLKDIMNRYRNKMVYDASTGAVKNDKKYMSMLEDFWMPRRDGGKGTEITSLPGAQNITGYLDSLSWFKEKMYESLSIPKSRLQQESGFSLGQSETTSRDEVKFQKFIDRLRNKFGQMLFDALKIQLKLKGICNDEEWENEIKIFLKLDFQKDNYFSELKNQEILTSRFTALQLMDNSLQKYISKEWAQKNILMLSDEDIADMKKQMDREKDDESCWPDWKLEGQFQSDQASEQMQQQMDAGMMGQQDPNAPQDPNAQQNPNAAPQFGQQNPQQQ